MEQTRSFRGSTQLSRLHSCIQGKALDQPERDAVGHLRSLIGGAKMFTYPCKTEVRQRKDCFASGLVLRQLEREVLIESNARQ